MPARYIEIRMDLTTRCNLRCIMCPNSLPSRHERYHELNINQVEKVAKYFFTDCSKLYLSWASEPFLSPNLFKSLKIAKEYQVPDIAIETNGTLLTPEKTTALIESGLTRLIVSLDGHTADTFDSIRKPPSFRQLINNLETFTQIRREKETRVPILEINFILLKDNLKELCGVIEIAAEIGAEQVNILEPFILDDLNIENIVVSNLPVRLIRKTINQARKLSRRRGIRLMVHPNVRTYDTYLASVYNKIDWLVKQFLTRSRFKGLTHAMKLAKFAALYKGKRCFHPYFTIYIKGNGDIIPCSTWYHSEPLAHIDDNELENLFSGTAWKELQNSMEGKSSPQKSCMRCPIFKSKLWNAYQYDT